MQQRTTGSIRSYDKRVLLERLLTLSPDETPADTVFPLLHEPDYHIRLLAAKVLARCKHPALFSHVMKQLPDADSKTKVVLIDILRELGNPAAALQLWDCLLNSNADVRFASALAFAVLGEEAMRFALEQWSRCDRESRVKVIRAFSRLPQGGEELFERALTDDDFWIRQETVKALSSRKNPATTRLLIKISEDSFPLVREEALRECYTRNAKSGSDGLIKGDVYG